MMIMRVQKGGTRKRKRKRDDSLVGCPSSLVDLDLDLDREMHHPHTHLHRHHQRVARRGLCLKRNRCHWERSSNLRNVKKKTVPSSALPSCRQPPSNRLTSPWRATRNQDKGEIEGEERSHPSGVSCSRLGCEGAGSACYCSRERVSFCDEKMRNRSEK